jgi:hypothetical protein
VAVVELSARSWPVGARVPGAPRLSRWRPAPSVTDLMALLGRLTARAAAAGRPVTWVGPACGAGRDGFRLARFLAVRGVEVGVIQPSGVPVDRRARRAKTDALDIEMLLRTLHAWLRGEPGVCSMVPVPSEAEEDGRRPGRERQDLIRERTALCNKIDGVLATLGVAGYAPRRRDRRARLEELRTPEGDPLLTNARRMDWLRSFPWAWPRPADRGTGGGYGNGLDRERRRTPRGSASGHRSRHPRPPHRAGTGSPGLPLLNEFGADRMPRWEAAAAPGEDRTRPQHHPQSCQDGVQIASTIHVVRSSSSPTSFSAAWITILAGSIDRKKLTLRRGNVVTENAGSSQQGGLALALCWRHPRPPRRAAALPPALPFLNQFGTGCIPWWESVAAPGRERTHLLHRPQGWQAWVKKGLTPPPFSGPAPSAQPPGSPCCAVGMKARPPVGRGLLSQKYT